jgi:flagellar protein FlaJ
VKTLRQLLREYLNNKAVAGGYSWDTNAISKYVEGITYALLVMPAVAYVLTRSLLLAAILAVASALPISLTIIWAEYSVDTVRSNVEWELPFFTVLLDVVHDVGGNITHAFEISGKVGLRWISREWSIINRYALTTNSITKAMQLRARVHPSLEFQRFINGYVSVWSYSGDVVNYVSNVEGTYLSMLSSRLSALSRQIIDAVLAVTSSIVIMVLFMIIVTVLGVSGALMYILPSIALVIPALILRVYASIPYIIRISIKHDRWMTVVLGVSVIISVLLMLYYGVYGMIALALPPVLFSVLVTRGVDEMKNSILSLPDLMRDVSEMVKAGVSMGAALERVLGNQYPSLLINYLRKATQFNDYNIDGSWVMKYAIGILREISSLGSPSKALDKLVRVFLDVKALLMGINYNARSLQILNYSLPFIFAGISYVSRFVVSMLSSVIENAQYSLVGLVIPSMNTVLAPLMITAYIISLSLAILSSLLSDLTLNPSVKFMAPVPLTLVLMLMVTTNPIP